MKRRALLFLFATAVFAAAIPASAETPPSSDAVGAQLFFERGREAAARGDAAEACRNFEESLRLEIAVGTLFNLAHCEEELGRLASAWQHLREGVDRLEDNDLRRKPALASAAAIEPRIPHLEVRLADKVRGRVFRDGVELSGLSLGAPLPVNPGTHVIRVRAEGHLDATYSVELAEGARRALVVSPGALAPSSTPPIPPKRSSAIRTTGWITGGLGAASLGVGLVTGALAFERSRVVHNHCDGSGTCDEDGLNALDASKRFGVAATITLATGAALLATGVVLVMLGKPDVEARAAARAPKTAPSLLEF